MDMRLKSRRAAVDIGVCCYAWLGRVDRSVCVRDWSIERSAELYRLQGWGEPYFTIGESGHLQVSPTGDGTPTIDLYGLVKDLQTRNLTLPLLIRFPDIL